MAGSNAATRFKPGQSGNPAGRPKKILARVDELCHQAGVHPFTELMKILKEGSLEDKEKANIWLQLLSYVQGKAKTLEDDEPSDLEKLTTAELIKLVKSLPEPSENT